MTTNLAYCAVRRQMEEHCWLLTSKHSSATGRLLQIIGKDHEVFETIRRYCNDLRQQLLVSSSNLKEHRRKHKC